MSDKVLKLAEFSGNSLTNEEIASWMEAWAGTVRKVGPIRQLIVIAESDQGKLDMITTGLPTDRTRLVGLLATALQYKIDGSLDHVLRSEES